MTGTPRTHHDRTSGDPASPQATVTWDTYLDHVRAAQLALLLLGPRPAGDESGDGRDELQAVGIEDQIRACRGFAEHMG